MDYVRFSFEPKWREELVCSCKHGSFSLELTMGSGQEVYLPTQEAWQLKAPVWAQPLWEDLRSQLASWCGDRIPLQVTESAPIY